MGEEGISYFLMFNLNWHSDIGLIKANLARRKIQDKLTVLTTEFRAKTKYRLVFDFEFLFEISQIRDGFLIQITD